jgi:hypothetical protein
MENILTVAGYIEGNCGKRLKLTDAYLEVSVGLLDCKTLINSPLDQPKKITFSID